MTKPGGNHSSTGIILHQNTPNPFIDKTVISYFIPGHVKHAQIRIFNDMGLLVKKFDIKNSGEGSITFYSSDSRKRLYSYTIVADGKLVDTKKMIR